MLVILLLIAANGVLAGAEIAVLTLRRPRLQQLLERGRRGARAIQHLRQQPERFLATVQVGITVVSATAAAFGGARLAGDLAPVLERMPLVGAHARPVALALVVALVSFLSVVLGELVPKSLALRHAERYALAIARLLLGLAWIARPLVWFLTACSNALLRPFGDRTTFTEARESTEELQIRVEEASRAGALDAQAGEIASRALDFGQLTAADVMVPRQRIDAIPRQASQAELRSLFLERGHSRMPVYDGTLDNVVGYIITKDLVALAWEDRLVVLEDLLRPARFVPETMAATRLLQEMRRQRSWLVLVVDEHGGLAGLVTLEDLIEELVGDIVSEHDQPEPLITPLEDGRALVRGDAPVRDVNRALGIELPEGERWSTVGGLCIALTGGIPRVGQQVEAGKVVLEVMEASARAVGLVRVGPRPPAPPPDGTET